MAENFSHLGKLSGPDDRTEVKYTGYRGICREMSSSMCQAMILSYYCESEMD